MASWEQFFSSAQASLTFVQHAVMSRRILCMPSLAMLLFAELHVISFLQWRVDEWYAIMRRCFLVNFRILLLRFWSWAHFSDYLFIIVSSFFFIVSWFLLSVRRAQFIFYFKKKAFPSSNLRCIGWFGSQKVWDHAAREGLLSFSLVFFWAWNQRLTRQSSARCAAANFAVVRALESYKL